MALDVTGVVDVRAVVLVEIVVFEDAAETH